MKRFLMVCFVLMLMAAPTFAGSFVATLGSNVDVYGQDNNFADVNFTGSFGYGFQSETQWLGGLLPDETYLVGQYTRYESDTSDGYVAAYSVSGWGLYYLHSDSARTWRPFFVAQADVDNLFASNNGDLATVWNGNLGLGGTYRVTDRTELFGAATVSLAGSGPLFTSDLNVGLRISL